MKLAEQNTEDALKEIQDFAVARVNLIREALVNLKSQITKLEKEEELIMKTIDLPIQNVSSGS